MDNTQRSAVVETRALATAGERPSGPAVGLLPLREAIITRRGEMITHNCCSNC